MRTDIYIICEKKNIKMDLASRQSWGVRMLADKEEIRKFIDDFFDYGIEIIDERDGRHEDMEFYV